MQGLLADVVELELALAQLKVCNYGFTTQRRLTDCYVDIDPFIVEGANPPARQTATTPFGMLLRLDSNNGTGLTEQEFRSLFHRCNRCRIYATKHAFTEHSCSVDAILHQVIDLTADED